MKAPETQITSINSQPLILTRLGSVITDLWLQVTELVPDGDFEVEKFDLDIPKMWLVKGLFSKKTQLTVESVSKKIREAFPAQLEAPQLYKVGDSTIRVVFSSGYPQEALNAHRGLAKKIFTVSTEERDAIVEQIPNYQDINAVMALMMSFIEYRATQVLSTETEESFKSVTSSSKLMNDAIFEAIPPQAAGVFAQASRNIVRFCYSWYFLEQHLIQQGYYFDDKELFKRLYYTLIPEAFFPVMSSKLHYEQAATKNPNLCNPNLLSPEIWEQIEKDYKHAKWLEKPRVCPALSIEIFTQCKGFLFNVFEEASNVRSLWWKLHADNWLDTILDFDQFLDISPELLDSHVAVRKIANNK